MSHSRDTHIAKPFRLLTLGGAALVDETGTVVAEQRRRLALLALIAARRDRGVSRDALMACLSPDSPLESARHALHQLIYYVRQQLGEDVFAGTDPLRLNPAVVTCDATEFELALDAGSLADAAALYRGPFLEGFHLGDSAEFEEWAASERSRLAARHADALVHLAQAADAAGDASAAIAAWRQLVSLDPHNGRAALGFMRALAAAGDREGAIRHARAHEALVRADTGAPADADVAEFAAALRRGEHRPEPRRDPAPAAPVGAAQSSDRVAKAPLPRRRLMIAGGAGALIALALAAVLAPERSIAPARQSGALLTAVVPFRVSPADSGFAWLREGMVELLTIRLAGEGGIGIVDAGRLLSAWHRALPDARDPGNDGPRVAASVGAQRIIEGSVVGTPTHVVLTASLVTVPGARTLARAAAEGPPDSLPALIDRLAAQLLGASAGVKGDRLAALTSPSFPAIRAFLAGTAAFRRGRAEEAVQRFRDAVTLDTTFALAGLELLRAATWTVSGADLELGTRRAHAGRERLSAADRAWLDAMTGRFRSAPDMFRRWNAAVAAYPDRSDVWYGLADNYFHWGMLAGIEDALSRAEFAIRRGWALDSAADGDSALSGPLLAEPIEHLVQLAHIRGDTAEVRRLVARVLTADSTSDMARALRWHRAVLDGAAARRAYWKDIGAAGEPTLEAIVLFITWTGIGTDDYAVAVGENRRRLTAHDPGYTTVGQVTSALNHGRPGEVPAASEVRGYPPRQGLRDRLRAATWWDGDTAAAREAERVLLRYADTPVTSARAAVAKYGDLCAMAHRRAAQGDFRGAKPVSERLRAVRMPSLRGDDSATFANYPRLCAALLDASRASVHSLPDTRSKIADADSLARDFIFEVCCGEAVGEANLLLARLWEKHGEPRRALEALRRRSGGLMLGTQYMSTFLREEGRLSALAGDTAAAVGAYRHYLALRHHPEPGVRPEVERVRYALAALSACPPDRLTACAPAHPRR